MIRRRTPPARSFAALAVALAALTFAGSAAAGGPREAQARKLLKQAIDEDYLETRFDDAETKLRLAISTCGEGWCSADVRARLGAARVGSARPQNDDGPRGESLGPVRRTSDERYRY